MCSEAEIDQKTGDGVSGSVTEAMKNASTLQAESVVNAFCRYNFSDAFSGLSSDVKYLLSDVVSGLVAIELIAYDMSGYTSRTEAENKINVLRDSVLRNLSLLRDKKVQEFMLNA